MELSSERLQQIKQYHKIRRLESVKIPDLVKPTDVYEDILILLAAMSKNLNSEHGRPVLGKLHIKANTLGYIRDRYHAHRYNGAQFVFDKVVRDGKPCGNYHLAQLEVISGLVTAKNQNGFQLDDSWKGRAENWYHFKTVVDIINEFDFKSIETEELPLVIPFTKSRDWNNSESKPTQRIDLIKYHKAYNGVELTFINVNKDNDRQRQVYTLLEHDKLVISSDILLNYQVLYLGIRKIENYVQEYNKRILEANAKWQLFKQQRLSKYFSFIAL